MYTSVYPAYVPGVAIPPRISTLSVHAWYAQLTNFTTSMLSVPYGTPRVIIKRAKSEKLQKEMVKMDVSMARRAVLIG